MYCPKCGAQNDDSVRSCAVCGRQLADASPLPSTSHQPRAQGAGSPASPHLVPSILVTLFCCQPLGIVAIVFSAMAMSKNTSGDYAGAHADAKRAGLFALLGLIIGPTLVLLYIVFVVMLGLLAGSSP